MYFKDITHFTNTTDYLPIITAAIITDIVIIIRVVIKQIKSKSLTEWYKKYALAGVLADVLSIVIGVVIARFLYPFITTRFSLPLFIGLAIAVQLTHDVVFAQVFNAIPRGKSEIMDTFKDYAKEFGPAILIADALMIVSTIILGSLFASLSTNTNVIILIVTLYLLPYFLYSIP